MPSTTDSLQKALSSLFDRHRIVFWYDAKKELRDEFEALSLTGIEKLEILNNQFGLKYRILREQPDQRFLIYAEGPQPDDIDNWLLDVQLAHGEFRTDQAAIWLSELELDIRFAELVEAHSDFFQANKRKEALKKQLATTDTESAIKLKMLAVCAGSDPRLDAIVENLLQELAEDRDDKIKLIERCRLQVHLWEQVSRFYGYKSEDPSVLDFIVELFKSCYAMGTEGEFRLNGDALVFLKRWKDNRRFESSFQTLSKKVAEILNIEQDLSKRDFRELIELDYFREIDLKIISDLAREVSAQTVSPGNVAVWMRQRRQGHWYSEFKHLYEAIDYAAQFGHALTEATLGMSSLSEAAERYAKNWFMLDLLYRKFIFHASKAGQATLMKRLREQIENLYCNNYLLKLGDQFQTLVDEADNWGIAGLPSQRTFFSRYVKPFLRKDTRICVIISDAMRYEIGHELTSLILQEDRYSAEVEPALTLLPSYTQLGMAALLPNEELTILDNSSATVQVDGRSSQGTENRSKILKAALDGRGAALKAEDFMHLDRESSRELLKANNVVYIYHNRIDHTGDKIHSEGQAFEAAEQTLEDLVRLVKKLTSANATNILITADHGFIYQDQVLAESDFSSVDAEGDQICYRDRRFVLGKGLKTLPGLHTFTVSQLGLGGDMEVQIPKSINRLRLKGSGSRFVHGGASLQEVIFPVIKINKRRQSDVKAVEIEILRGASSVITAGQLSVVFYQASPVDEKNHLRVLRAGIYSEAGKLISDSHELAFDLTSENPRGREIRVQMILSKEADELNGQEVILKLEERHAGTSHYKEYKSIRYTLRRSFTSDFDF